jgi:cytoskeleton protein RodZ
MDRQASRGHRGNVSSTAGAGPAGVDPAEFAEYLRAERERRRLTLEQIADETKIASRHLAALERGDVRSWPGGMYRRAMMRAYAESIGVDREYALKQFEQAFDAPPSRTEVPAPEAHAAASVARWRPSRRQLLATGTSVLTIVAVFVAWNLAARLMRAGGDVARTAVAEPTAAPPTQTRASTRVPTTNVSRPAVALASVQETVATTGSPDPRPLATEANLIVTSEPAGARVTVNGIGWGETPITIKHLEFGQKRVRLTMQGYISQERVLSLGPERPHGNVRFTLRER